MNLVSSSVALAIISLLFAVVLLLFHWARARQAVDSAQAEHDQRTSQRLVATARLALILGDGETVPGVLWSEHESGNNHPLPDRGGAAAPGPTGSSTTGPQWISGKA